MASTRIVALTTDFGSRDTFVGQMKAAALSVYPDLAFVDLTHEVPAHDIEAGAYLLWSGCFAFPSDTIHVVVVDPGVGTARRGLVVRTERYYFVTPDNGILTRVLEDEPLVAAHALTSKHLRAPAASATFEGRDVFAHAAAWIARGVAIEEFGPGVEGLVMLPRRRPAAGAGLPVRVRVLWVDRFGNATLDFSRRDLASSPPAPRIRVDTPRGAVGELRRTYADGPRGIPFLVFNSSDHLEIALREEPASERLGIGPGMEVTVTIGP